MKNIDSVIRSYLEKRGWGNQHPEDLAKSITVEAAELLEHFQWGRKSIEEYTVDEDFVRDVKYELADILIYAHSLAHGLGFTFDEAIQDKLKILEEKYPVTEVQNGNAKKIHDEHRKGKITGNV